MLRIISKCTDLYISQLLDTIIIMIISYCNYSKPLMKDCMTCCWKTTFTFSRCFKTIFPDEMILCAHRYVSNFIWWQWCWWHRYVGDFMMVTDLRCWWQNYYVPMFKMTNMPNRSPTSHTYHQHIWSSTSVTNIDVTFYSYIKIQNSKGRVTSHNFVISIFELIFDAESGSVQPTL